MIDFKVTFQEEKPIQVDFFDEASSKNTEFGETQTINIGRPGDSAYDIAVQNGFVGTQEEWLWSLKGEVGPQGIQGPQGEQGAPGKDGKDGKDGADGYTPVKGTDYFTESDKQEIAEQAAELVEVPEGVTSWNDLIDKPFGVGTTEWKQIASSRSADPFKSVTSIGVMDLTLSAELGHRYRIVFQEYGLNLIRIESTVIATQATSITGPYISLGTKEDDICAYQLQAGMPWTFDFKNPISFPVGYDLFIYEAVETITTLDEKFLPNTIARVEDIPKVPTKLSELENDTGYITADDIPEGGVTSWNDLTDKPFGETYDWVEKIWEALSPTLSPDANGYYSAIVTRPSGFKFVAGEKYKIVATIGLLTKEYEYTATSKNYATYVGTTDDDVYLVDLSPMGGIALNFKASNRTTVILRVYAYGASVKTLDEKYLPDTIARTSDIPEIPEVPTKLSELENDAGFITADEVPEPIVSWNDLTDKPFGEEPLFDIQWDGDTNGRFVLDMSELGYDDGLYFVKVSDFVPSREDIIGGKITDNSGEVGSITEEYIDNSMFPGAYVIDSIVTVVYEQNSVNSAFGLPDGYITNGTYFLLWGDNFVSSFSSTVVVKIDEKFIPDFVTSWNDLTDKPFGESPPTFDITWDGDMTGHETLLLEENTYFVKVSDEVLTKEQLLNSTMYYSAGDDYTLTEENIYVEDEAGLIDLGGVVVVFSAETFIGAMGLPEGSVSNGVWFFNRTGEGAYYVNRFVASSSIKKLDNKYLDLEGYAKTEDLEGYAKTEDLSAVATSGSWNDLEDKPFGEGEAIEWKEIAYGLNSQTGSLTNFNVTPTSKFTLIPEKNYKIVVNASMVGSRETIGIASKQIFPDFSEGYTIGSVEDAVRLSARPYSDGIIMSFTIILSEPIRSIMGVTVTIYEENRAVKPLDEKYLPDSVVLEDELTAKGYQTEAQVTALINNALGVIENGSY